MPVFITVTRPQFAAVIVLLLGLYALPFVISALKLL